MGILLNPEAAWKGHQGGVICYQVRGHWYLRSMPLKVRNPRTAKQLVHRNRFAASAHFALATSRIHRVAYASCQNPYLAYRRRLLAEAFGPDGQLDPLRAPLSRGPLHKVEPLCTGSGPGWTILMWNNSVPAKPDLRLCLCVYNHTRRQAVNHIDCAAFADGVKTVTWPLAWQGDHLYIYASCRVKDTDSTDGIIADTLYFAGEDW